MPKATAADGTELHWEERGDGPTVLLIAYWSYHPSVWAPLTAELERDHRVVRYDDRGTGRSERQGPYDIETAAADLEAVAETAGGGPMVAVCLVDGSHRAARIAARRPDLISHVVGSGGAALGRSALEGSESMISSNTVVNAFMQQLETDYRAAIRGIMEAANPQMTRDELRARVVGQAEHVPADVAAARARAWSDDEGAAEPARALGERLTVLLSDDVSGGWFPDSREMRRVMTEHFPRAQVEHVDDGIVSRPDLTAAVVRRLAAAPAPGVESLP